MVFAIAERKATQPFCTTIDTPGAVFTFIERIAAGAHLSTVDRRARTRLTQRTRIDTSKRIVHRPLLTHAATSLEKSAMTRAADVV